MNEYNYRDHFNISGVAMYELHAPIMILTTRRFEAKKISKKDLKSELKKVAIYLTESSNILRFEMDTTMEGVMGIAAKEALDRVKEWEKIIGTL